MPVDVCSPAEGVWYSDISSLLIIMDIENAGRFSAHTTLRHLLSTYWLAQFISLVSWALNVFQNLKSLFRISKICQNINDMMVYLLPGQALNHFCPSLRYHLKTVFSFTQQKPDQKLQQMVFMLDFFLQQLKTWCSGPGKKVYFRAMKIAFLLKSGLSFQWEVAPVLPPSTKLCPGLLTIS